MTRQSDDGAASAPPPAHLTDPTTCGEDLAYNLRVVGELADKYCGSCAGYHVLYAAKRTMPNARVPELDRKEMAEAVMEFAGERLAAARSDLEILVAGAADTGLLATAAHALALLGGAALIRSRFTVLDRCRTPLELCRTFGERHSLSVETDVVDLASDQTPRSADLIVVHSLFRHMPKEAHLDVLRKFGRWLRPGGRIVFSSRLEDGAGAETFEAHQRYFSEEIRRRFRDGQLTIGEGVEAFDTKLSQRSTAPIAPYDDLATLETLFAAAGMPVLATKIAQAVLRRSERDVLLRRAVVVLGPPRS